MNEATYEAGIRHALSRALPWLKYEDIQHQKTFTVQLGRTTHTIDGEFSSTHYPRLDILITHEGKNIAILELKSPGIELTESDEKQGRSYARLLDQIAPLTIISNGDDVRVLNSITGEKIGFIDSKTKFGDILRSINAIAVSGIEEAIKFLVGSNIDVWKKIIFETTHGKFSYKFDGNIDDLLIFPRELTEKAIISVLNNKFSLITGESLIGKTTLLYELFTREKSENYYTLYLDEYDGGIFESLSKLISHTLKCAISVDETRIWMEHFSNVDGDKLIIGIDDLESDMTQVLKDIIDITSEYPARFGKNVAVIATCHSEHIEDVLIDKRGYGKNIVAKRVNFLEELKPLNDEEFWKVCELLCIDRVGFLGGANLNVQYRYPVNISSAYRHSKAHQPKNENVATVIPSTLCLDVFEYSGFNYVKNEIKFLIKKIGSRIINDIYSNDTPHEYFLYSLKQFSILEDSLKSIVTQDELNELKQTRCFKKLYLNNLCLYTINFGGLIVTAVKDALREKISKLPQNEPEEIARILSYACSVLKFGDIIGAVTILESNLNEEALNGVIDALVSARPHKESICGKIAMVKEGSNEIIDIDLEQFPEIDEQEKLALSNPTPWLILSQMLRIREGTPYSYIHIGSCEYILLRPEAMTCPGFHVHTLKDGSEILCQAMGVIEPITMSVYSYITSLTDEDLISFCDLAIESNSQHLLNRLSHALAVAITDIRVNQSTVLTQQKRVAELLIDDFKCPPEAESC